MGLPKLKLPKLPKLPSLASFQSTGEPTTPPAPTGGVLESLNQRISFETPSLSKTSTDPIALPKIPKGAESMEFKVGQVGERVDPLVEFQAMEKLRKVAEAAPPYYEPIGALKTFGKGLTLLPKQIASKIVMATQGHEGASVVHKDWGDRLVSGAQEEMDEFLEHTASRYSKGKFLPGISVQDIAELPQNIAYSGVTAMAGLGAGLPLALIPEPTLVAKIAAWGVGTTVAGKVAYEMTTYEIMQEYLEIKAEQFKAQEVFEKEIPPTEVKITLQQEQQWKKEFESLARKYGLWEAIPEAVSQALGLKILTSPLTKMFGTSMATRILGKLGSIYGEELLTETVTEMGQLGIRAEAGLPGGREVDWTSPTDWMQALKDIAPQTFLLSTVLGGTASASIRSQKMIAKLRTEIGEKHPLYKQFEAKIKSLIPQELPIGLSIEDVSGKELEPLAQEARKYASAEEFARSEYQKQKQVVEDLLKKSDEAFAKSEGIEGTAKMVRQNERYIKIGTELKNRAIREERKLLKITDKSIDFYNQATKGKEVKKLVEIKQPPAKAEGVLGLPAIQPEIKDLISGGKELEGISLPSQRTSAEETFSENLRVLLSNLSASKVPFTSETLKIDPSTSKNFTEVLSLINNNVNSLLALYHKAGIDVKSYLDILEEVAGNKTVDLDIKTPESIVSKIIRKRDLGFVDYWVDDVNDVIRGRIIFENQSGMGAVVKTLGDKVVDIDDYFSKANGWGYRGININIKLPSGRIAEIQLHTKDSKAIQEKIWKIYSKWRGKDAPVTVMAESRKIAEAQAPGPLEQLTAAEKGKATRQMNTMIKEEAEALKEMEEGRTGGFLVERIGEEGFTRGTEHSPAYQAFYQEHGRGPATMNDWRKIAKMELEAGRSAIGQAEAYLNQAKIAPVRAEKAEVDIDVAKMFETTPEDAERARMERIAKSALVTKRDKAAFLESLSEELQTKIKRSLRLSEQEGKQVGRALETLIQEGTLTERKVTIPEKQALKMRLRAEARGAKRGVAKGKRVGKAEIIEKIKAQRASVVQIKKDITEYAKELPLNERGKLLATVKNAKTYKDLEKARTYIEKLDYDAEHRRLLGEIKKELKEPFATKQKVGKFSPEATRILKSYKEQLSFVNPESLKYKKLERVAQWRNENPNEPLPESVVESLDELDRTHLKLLNNTELAEQLESIKLLKSVGRTFKQLKLEKIKRERQEMIDKFTDIVTGGKGVKPPKFKPKRAGLIGRAWEKVRGLDKRILTQDTFLDILDENSKVGIRKGSIHTYFNRLLNKARDVEIAGRYAQFETIQNKLKELDIERTLNDKEIIDGIALTRDELIDIYVSKHDKAQLASIMEGGFVGRHGTFTPQNDFATGQFLNQVDQQLTSEEKAFGDFLLELYEESYEPINRVYRETNFMDMPKNEGYSPMYKDLDFVQEEDINIAKQQLDYAKASVPKGFTKIRTGSLAPIRLGAINKVADFMVRTEHYKAFELSTKEMHSILKGMKPAVMQEYGTDFYKIIRRWLEDVASDGRFTASDMGKVWLSIRRNVTKSMIANLVTSVKQTISLSGFLTEISEPKLAKGVASYWKNKKAWDAFWDGVPQIANRSETMTRDIAEIGRARSAVDKIFKRRGIREKQIALVRLMDKLTVRGGATAVYLAEGGTLTDIKEVAIEKAVGIVRRTQPTGDIKDLASLQRGGAIEKLMTMFMNQPNKYYNVLYSNIRAYAKGRATKGQLARAMFYAWIVPSVVFELVSSGGSSDWEDYLKAIGLGPFRYVLILGNLVDAARTGFDYQFSPVMEIPQEISEAFRDLLQGDILDAMLGAGETTLMTAGVALPQPKRTLQGAYDILTGKTDDWRRLIWSRWSLGQTTTGKTKKGKAKGLPQLPSLPKLPKLPKLPTLPKLPSI